MLGGVTHDISIMDSSIELGLMLDRDQYGRLAYKEKEMDPFSFMQAAGYLDETSQNPQAMYPLAFQKSWVGGFGQPFMKGDEPRRYLASYGVDASEDGILKMGPDWTAITAPTLTASPTLANGNLETWTTSTNAGTWTETTSGSGAVTKEATYIHGGTYSAKLDSVVAAGTNEARISQSLTWNNIYRSKRFSASAWYYLPTAPGGAVIRRFRLYDGKTYTDLDMSVLQVQTRVVINKTLASDATELTVIAEVDSNNVSIQAAYVDDITFTGYALTGGNCYAEYNGLQYMSFGDCLYKANSATTPTAWTYVAQFGSVITCLYPASVSGTSYLFIMIGPDQNGWYYDGTTATQMTDAGGTDARGSFITAATTTFYISGPPTTVFTTIESVLRTNTTPLAGAWSTDISCGLTNINNTGLKTVNNVIYIAKENSLWKVNSTGTTDMLIDYTISYASTSGKNMFGWNNNVYIPCGVNALLEYIPGDGTYSNISPAAIAFSTTQAKIATASAVLSGIQTDFDGRIMAIAGDDSWLWVIQDNGTVNNLFKGQYANIDGTGWHWHPVANTTMADVNCMAVSSLTTTPANPVIWVGAGTTNGYYNPGAYETSDPTYTIPCLITPYYTGGVWRMMKELYTVILGLESITANVYVTLQYRFYGTTAWSTPVLIYDGEDGEVSNGQDSNFMPKNSFGTAIQFRLNFVSNASTATPKITRINGEGIIKSAEVSVIECTVMLQDNQLMRTGARDTMPASRKKSGLNTIRASNWPVTFYDIEGTTLNVDLMTREDASAPERRLIGNNRYTKSLLLKKVVLS